MIVTFLVGLPGPCISFLFSSSCGPCFVQQRRRRAVSGFLIPWVEHVGDEFPWSLAFYTNPLDGHDSGDDYIRWYKISSELPIYSISRL